MTNAYQPTSENSGKSGPGRLESAAPAPRKPSGSILRRLGIVAGVSTAIVLIAGTAAAGIAILHMRAGADPEPAPHPAITVATQPLQISSGYEAETRFMGRLEAARETTLAFERGGLVLEVIPEEGDRVAKGEAIAKLDTAPLQRQRAQLVAQRKEITAQRDLARTTLQRQTKLNRQGWSPEQRFDEARFTLARFDASIERIEAQISAIDLDIEKSVIKAPFAGVVASRLIDEGSVVSAGTGLATLLEDERRLVRIGLSPEAARALKPQKSYRFSSAGRQFEGKLWRKRADLSTGTRTVTALFEVSGAESVPLGESVAASIDVRREANGSWLPMAALTEGRKGIWTVYFVDRSGPEKTIDVAGVEILHIAGERVFVRTALKPGTPIVVEGGNRVIEGQRVALSDDR